MEKCQFSLTRGARVECVVYANVPENILPISLQILNEISFFVGTCATLSGLSHAFIFAMAHRLAKRL